LFSQEEVAEKSFERQEMLSSAVGKRNLESTKDLGHDLATIAKEKAINSH